MTQRRLVWGLGWALAATACRGPETVSSPEVGKDSVAAAAPSEPSVAASKDDGAPPSAAGTPEPEPEPEPPPPPTLPDGTPIVACAEPPPPGMACIPGGAFLRGTTDEEPANARPQATIWLQTFYMDVDEVTVEDYEACKKYPDRSHRCTRRSGPQYLDFDHPRMPIQGPSWYDSRKFCEIHGKDLPTEAQWEKAARGTEGALYSWGDEPVTCERAIIKEEPVGRGCGQKKMKGTKPETGRPLDVGSRAAGIYGLNDMMGNSWEWVIDWYSPSYEECGEACEGQEPRGPCDGAEECPGHYMRIVRGGSWYWDASRATAVFRRPHFPKNDPFHHFGFRCAASVEQAQAMLDGAAAEPEGSDEDAPADGSADGVKPGGG